MMDHSQKYHTHGVWDNQEKHHWNQHVHKARGTYGCTTLNAPISSQLILKAKEAQAWLVLWRQRSKRTQRMQSCAHRIPRHWVQKESSQPYAYCSSNTYLWQSNFKTDCQTLTLMFSTNIKNKGELFKSLSFREKTISLGSSFFPIFFITFYAMKE